MRMKKRLNEDDFLDGVCAPVAIFMEDAVAYLKKEGRYADCDYAAMYMLSKQLDTFFRAYDKLVDDGDLTTDNNGVPIPSVYIKIMNQAETMALRIMKDYGLTSMSRKLLQGKQGKVGQPSPIMEFMDD